MAKRQQETLNDILAPIVQASGLSLTEWCIKHQLVPRTVYRLRNGGRAHLSTMHMLAVATGCTVDQISRAIAASRKE